MSFPTPLHPTGPGSGTDPGASLAVAVERLVTETEVADLPRLIGVLAMGRALAEVRLRTEASHGADRFPAESGEDWVTPEEAAAITKKSREWLIRHHRTLPFARKLTGKTIVFSRRGAQRWLETRGR